MTNSIAAIETVQTDATASLESGVPAAHANVTSPCPGIYVHPGLADLYLGVILPTAGDPLEKMVASWELPLLDGSWADEDIRDGIIAPPDIDAEMRPEVCDPDFKKIGPAINQTVCDKSVVKTPGCAEILDVFAAFGLYLSAINQKDARRKVSLRRSASIENERSLAQVIQENGDDGGREQSGGRGE